MQYKITAGSQTWTGDVPAEEASLYKEIGKTLLELTDLPTSMSVETDNGNAKYTVTVRGRFVRNGDKKPSMYVVEESNLIAGLTTTDHDYPEVYLTCINHESNNYKYYHMVPDNIKRTIDVDYGRIGSVAGEAYGRKRLSTPYDARMFWIRYYEKLSKGYIDNSETYLTEEVEKEVVEEKSDIEDDNSKLYSFLMACAKNVIDETLANTRVTKGQIEKSKKLYSELENSKSLEDFNEKLAELMSVCPRKCRYVEEFLAKDPNEYLSILDREKGLIEAMSATTFNKIVGRFEDIDVKILDGDEKTAVVDRLNYSLQGRVTQVYEVIPRDRKQRFDAYLKENNITNTKLFWHGSRNENWFSILQQGPKLHPNAYITGKMLGQGLYYAKNSTKSYNYTSCNGAYWSRGNSAVGILGLFDTAYGNPLEIGAPGTIRHYTEKELKSLGKDCVHAYGGQYLRDDEICFYNEDAVVLKYLIVLN